MLKAESLTDKLKSARNRFIGARIIKTAISIVLALYLAILFDLPSPVLAGIGATFSVQPTVYRSYLSLIEQFSANVYGAIVAIILVLLFGTNPIIVGIGAIITILLTVKTNNEGHIGIALVTLVVIMEASGENFISFALLRFITIMLGVFAAFLVNVFILPPKYEPKLFDKIQKLTTDIINWLQKSSHNDLKFSGLKKDIDKMKEELVRTEQTYLFFKDDNQFYKKRKISKTRKIVVYRQMISTAKRALGVLRKFHRYEFDIHQMPELFRQATEKQLDILIEHHQLIFLSLSENATVYKVFDDTSLSELINLLAELKKMKNQDDFVIFHMMSIISAMIEYAEHIQHLQTLVHNQQNSEMLKKTAKG